MTSPLRRHEREVRDTLRASPWLVLVLVAFGEFMVVLDATIVNVALPSIQDDLGFSPGDLQWVVNGYTLLFGGFLLLGGRAADLFGRRRMFLTGMTLFTLASVANAVAQSPEVLVGGRALQGLGAAFVSPAALSIITSAFPSGPERTKALSIWAGVAAGGAGVGLLLGGVLTEALSWEWVFLINLPIGVATFLATLRIVPESRLVGHRGFDPYGAITVTAGLLVLVYAIVKAEEFGWGSERTLLLGAVSLVLLAAFVVIELRHREPLIQLGIFRIRSVAAANGTAILVAAAMFPLFFFGSLYLQDVRGFSPIESGAAFIPFTLSLIVGAGLAQSTLPRFGARVVALSGTLLAAGGLLYLTQLAPGSAYLGAVLPGFVAIGFGIGNVWLPMTMAATGNVGADQQGLASGLVNTSQQIGGALGLAILATIAGDRTGDAVATGTSPAEAAVDGFTLAFGVGSALFLAAFVVLASRLRREDVDVAEPHGTVGRDEPLPVAA